MNTDNRDSSSTDHLQEGNLRLSVSNDQLHRRLFERAVLDDRVPFGKLSVWLLVSYHCEVKCDSVGLRCLDFNEQELLFA